MSVITCLMQKAEAGLVSKKTAEKIAGEIDRLKGLMDTGTDVSKELQASQQAFDIITNRLQQKTRQAAIHLNLVTQGEKRFKEGVPVEAVLKSFNFTDEANGYRYGYLGDTALERIQHYQRVFTGMAADVLDKLDPKKVGLFRDVNGQLAIRKDMFALMRGKGERSSDPAVREISEAIFNLTKAGAESFERAGGNITQRKDFMLGRSPNSAKIAEKSVGEYVTDGMAAFDLDMIREATDGIISTPEQLKYALKKDYQAIISGGISDLAEFAPTGAKSVVNSRNHHRIFHFKDAESMQMWQEKYGSDNLYRQVVDYAERIGKDVGILETYGPKPEAFIRSMLRTAAEIDPMAAARLKDKMYREYRFTTGQWDRSLDPTMNKWLASYRSMNVANKLGSTVIDAAVMDAIGLNAVVKKMRGLPVLKSMFENFKLLFSTGLEADKKQWAKLGWLNEAFLNDAMYHLKASEAEGGHKIVQDLAQGVMKYTGLTRITNTTKGVNVRQLGDTLANTSWEEMPNAFKNWLSANGVDQAMLERVKQAGLDEVADWGGLKVVSPIKLYENGHYEDAARIGALFNRVQEIVSPTSSPELRAWFSDFERGSAAKQLLAGSFKTFTGYIGSFYNNHLRVLAALPGNGEKAKWAAATTTSLIMSGIVATWIRDMANGKDPQFDEKTVMRAIGRANVMPILGDYLLSAGSRFGSGSLTDHVAGVFLGDINTAARGISKAVTGNGVGAAKEGQRLLENLIPGKNSWYAGLILRRNILDQLQYLYDPQADKKFKATARRAEREGQGYWWAPGQRTPSRAPNPNLEPHLAPTPKKKRGN